MGQTLENSIYLPDEGETNCYSGLASNWRALDTLKGNYSAHAINVDIHVTATEKETWNGKADASALTAHTGDTTIHVTAADKQAWNGKADASALTAHTGDTTIHVTAEDKATWNGKADASALTAHTGDTTIHVTAEDKATWNGKADASALTAHTGDTTIHVTAEDKATWNGKADASALTAHTGDTTIHVTAEDKAAWNGKADASALTAHTGDTTIHVTAADKQTWDTVTNKANDADVMHLTGNEIVGGQKTLENLLPLKGEFLGTEASNNGRTLLYFIANRDTQGQSGIFLTKFRQNRPQGGMSGNDIAYLSFDCLENSVRTNNGLRINFLNFVDDIPQRFILWSGISEKLLGAVGAPWSDVFTDQINGLNPSSLGMPDLSNGIDISGYITHLDKVVNNYTPPANGWLSVRVKKTSLSHASLILYQTGGLLSSCEADEYNISGTNLPVTANQNVEIYIYADALVDAKFYPCQGNV